MEICFTTYVEDNRAPKRARPAFFSLFSPPSDTSAAFLSYKYGEIVW